MPKLKFFDVKAKKSFETDDYKIEEKQTKRGIRYFAVAISPSGNTSYRIVSKKFFEEFG